MLLQQKVQRATGNFSLNDKKEATTSSSCSVAMREVQMALEAQGVKKFGSSGGEVLLTIL